MTLLRTPVAARTASAAALAAAVIAALVAATPSDARARNGLIAFSQSTGDCDSVGDCDSYVWTVRPRGGDRRRLPCSAGGGGCRDVLPVFSSRGDRLATATNGINRGIFSRDFIAVRTPGGEVLNKIPEPDTLLTALAWSGDGRRLAFADRGVFIVGRDGRGQERFRSTRAGDLAWSSQGRLAWTFGRGGLITVTNAARTRVKQLKFAGSSVAWSPDGRRLAYLPSKGRVGRVRVARVTPSLRVRQSRTVTRRCNGEDGIEGDSDIAWSPDGRYLLCTTFNGQLIAVNIRTGRIRVVLRNPSKHPIISFDWQRAPQR